MPSDETKIFAARMRARWTWFVLGLIVLFAVCIRIRLLDQPLERDEGEYAYAGQLILQGVPPYHLAYNMKLPGTYFAYACIMAGFGQTPRGIHAGLTIVNAATIVMIFLLARRLFGNAAGLISAAAYALMSLSFSFYGIAAHANHFVVFCALAGVLLLFRAEERPKMRTCFLAGLLLGIGFLMKQQGIAFIVFGAFWILIQRRKFSDERLSAAAKTLSAFGFGAVTPFALTCLVLWAAGVFPKFWFWTFTYASKYVEMTSIPEGLKCLTAFWHGFVGPTGVFFWMAGACLIALAVCRTAKRKKLFPIAFLLASFAATSIGLYYRPHYFILMLPSMALLMGGGVATLAKKFGDEHFAGLRLAYVPALVLCMCLLYFVVRTREFLFVDNAEDVSRRTYPGSLFIECAQVASYIQKNSGPTDRIAVFGSEPEIYFLSQRRSAIGYIYMYPLFEEHPFALEMQRELMHEFTENKPEFVIIISLGSQESWIMRPGSERAILEWTAEYFYKFYERAGVVDRQSQTEIVYRWGDDAATYQPASRDFIYVLRRKKA